MAFPSPSLPVFVCESNANQLYLAARLLFSWALDYLACCVLPDNDDKLTWLPGWLIELLDESERHWSSSIKHTAHKLGANKPHWLACFNWPRWRIRLAWKGSPVGLFRVPAHCVVRARNCVIESIQAGHLALFAAETNQEGQRINLLAHVTQLQWTLKISRLVSGPRTAKRQAISLFSQSHRHKHWQLNPSDAPRQPAGHRYTCVAVVVVVLWPQI